VKLLTGNDLPSGDVVWWTGKAWSRRIEDSVDAGEGAEQLAMAEEAARRVNAPYVVDAEASPTGPLPAHIKDRVRAAGPSVRLDLAINPAIPLVKG
jgi:hypothetical protein